MKDLIQKIGFFPKENAKGIFIKKYFHFDNYAIEVDFENKKFNYGNKIVSNSATTQNFSQDENWVVLECVDRLITKGYNPSNIVLEKIYPSGHGTSGRLDILVKKDDKAYLMIECKTWGKEFEKEFNNLNKNGGQLFTYFQQDTYAEYLVLYASKLDKNKIEYRNEIVKIEEDYRQAGNVKDLYERWNKLTKTNGLFDDWVHTYEFQSKAIIIKNLKDIKQTDAQKIFNRFAEILRKHTVSDKPNAFNKIFNLFLCKICDEYTSKDGNEEAKFQWKDSDTNEIFQNRLNRLYRDGMSLFLGKKIIDFDEQDLKEKYPEIANNEDQKKYFMNILNEIRLKKNNEFAIKDVYDDKTFEENAKVLKECVELLQEYKIRYDKRHPYLSDFFELLLTTGLKQESGQFFTPIPVARYIIKSLPIKEIFNKKLSDGNFNDLLPLAIDYASGSGHFLHEFMHEIQNYIEKETGSSCSLDIKNEIESWKIAKFKWAKEYVYGIEKDYRLAKVGKVGCYLHGDGLAQVINGDGLDNFQISDDYVGVLSLKGKSFYHDKKENPVFDVVIANPPYSVSNFKANIKNAFESIEDKENSFELYNSLTDQSSEIECLFIERTKQLLKDGGVAGIILPSSILSNTGIYTKTREIILKYFEIIGITQLGSGTFMATGTNTVVLFLRRRNNYDWQNIASSVDKFFVNFQDITVGGIENVFSKYVRYVWENLDFTDYINLCKKMPNEIIQKHEIFMEYNKKLKAKNEEDLYKQIIEREKEKLLYFILAYKQKIVLTKTGEKQEEKQFLGYEFSNRRGYEGIHAIQRSKTIDECTSLFDPNIQENPTKANFYTYKNFIGEDFEIDESMTKNVSVIDLVDMMTFDRVDFEKSMNLSVKKKIKIESKWESKRFDEIADIIKGVIYSKQDQSNIETNKIVLTADNINLKGEFEIKKQVFLSDNLQISDEKKLRCNDIFICFSSGSKEHLGKVAFIKNDTNYYAGGFMGIIRVKNNNEPKYFFQLLNTLLRQTVRDIGSGSNINNLSGIINEIKIPLPPKDIQEKIVKEIEEAEKREEESKKRVENSKKEINNLLDSYFESSCNIKKLGEVAGFKRGPFGGSLKKEIFVSEGYKVYEQQHAIKNNFEIGRYYITEEKFQEMKSFELLENDLIMSCSGTIGKIAIFPKNAEKGIINQALLRFRPKKEFTSTKYLKICLSHITRKFEDSSHGTGLKNVASVDILKDIDIHIPSLPEQQKIISEIEKIEQEIETLQTEIDNAKKQKEEVLRKYL